MIEKTYTKLPYVKLIVDEAKRAKSMFPPFNSAHEGYGVIKEEFDEFWDEIKRKPKDWDRIEDEAIQLGAMALRFLTDLCWKKDLSKNRKLKNNKR